MEFRDNLINKTTLLIMCLFAALLYQVAWQYPLTDSLALAERLLDPSYLLNDFHTNTLADYTPRAFTIELIVSTSEFLNVDYMSLILVLNFVRVFSFFIIVYWLFKGITDNKVVAFLGVFLAALSFLKMPLPLAWWATSYDFTPSNIAAYFSVLGWALVFHKKLPLAISSLALAMLFHPVVAIHASFATVLFLYIKVGFQGIFEAAKNPWNYLPLAPYFWFFIQHYTGYEYYVDDETFYNINVLYRHAHHFLITHANPVVIFGYSLSVIMVLFIAFKTENNIARKFAFPVLIYVLVLTLLNFIFVELMHNRTASSLILLRGSPVFTYFFVLSWAHLCYQKWQSKDFLTFGLMILPFFPYVRIGLSAMIIPNIEPNVLPISLFVIASSSIIISTIKPNVFAPINNTLGVVLNKMSLSLLLLTISIVLLAVGYLKYDSGIANIEDREEIYLWIDQNTSMDDILLAETNGVDNQAIRLINKRALVATKDFPFNEKYYIEWYERYMATYGTRDTAYGAIDRKSAIELNIAMDRYSGTILLRTKELEENHHFQLIGKAKGKEHRDVFIYRNLSF